MTDLNSPADAGRLHACSECSPGAEAPRRFRSPLAPHLEAFIALKRAMGRCYETAEKDLATFDRFVQGFDDLDRGRPVVSRDLVHAWLRAGHHLHPRTRKKRLGLIRQFCLYLLRFESSTYLPGPELVPIRAPRFRPYIYPPEEVRALLRAALQMRTWGNPLRPGAFYTIILILYAAGLRIGEALRLRIHDIDLPAGTLFIRDTKFFKARLLPLSKSLCDAMAGYLRDRHAAAPDLDAFLFINSRGRPYDRDKFTQRFHQLAMAAGVPHRQSASRPRVHDIRHTFALTNLLRWYREGADLYAKLPLLATYMGHASVLSTEEYLRATPELLLAASQRFERAYGTVLCLPQRGTDADR